MKQFDTMFEEYKAFLLTIESYIDDEKLIQKLSLEFINGTFSPQQRLGCGQICSNALGFINCTSGNTSTKYFKTYVKKSIASIHRIIKSLKIEITEFEMAVSPFLILYKNMPKKYRVPNRFVVPKLKYD